MNFQNIAERFEHSESGTDSFKNLSVGAFELMKIDPDNAALYFVVGVAARAYVRRYDDQGVAPEFSDRAKAMLVGYNTKIVRALASDASTRVRLLGEVAVDYEWNNSEF